MSKPKRTRVRGRLGLILGTLVAAGLLAVGASADDIRNDPTFQKMLPTVSRNGHVYGIAAKVAALFGSDRFNSRGVEFGDRTALSSLLEEVGPVVFELLAGDGKPDLYGLRHLQQVIDVPMRSGG